MMETPTASIEILRDELRRRFPLAVVASWPDSAASGQHERDGNPFATAVGWPLPSGSLLMLSGHGSTCLAWGLMKRIMTDEHMRVGYVDGSGAFFPAGAHAFGIDLRHLLWVGGQGAKHCLRAAELMLQSRAFGLVVLDIGRGRLSSTAGRRLSVFLRQSSGRLVFIDRPRLVHHVKPTRSLVIEQRFPRWYGGVQKAGIDGWLLHIRIDGRGGVFVLDTRYLDGKRRGS